MDRHFPTYFVAFVWLTARDHNGMKNNVSGLEVFHNSFPVNFVDGFVDDRKAGVVPFRVDTRGV